ncbi:MAG: hypothetical protein K6V73_08585 [Firmicutes bacterium]|nr:hypothetical protein [Bacillota bacterium]
MSDDPRIPEIRRLAFAFDAAVAQAGSVLRQLTRTRALAIWIAYGALWPWLYVAALGNAGATPLYLMLSLAAFPIGPILASLLGASVAARQGAELEAAWPAPAAARCAGLALVLLAASVLSALATAAATLWRVAPSFWSPPGYAQFSLWTGISTLFATFGLWTAVGAAIGARTREPWRTVAAVLVPVAVLAVAALTTFDPVGLVRFLSLSPPAAWFLDQSGAYGLGPAFALHGPVLVGTVALLLVALAVAGMASYGRNALSAVAGWVGAGAVLALTLGQGVWAPPAEPFSTASYAYRRGTPSPVAVRAVDADLSLLGAPSVVATVRLTIVPRHALSQVRAFLVPAFRVERVAVGGRPARWIRRDRAGWLTFLPARRLLPAHAVDVSVTYEAIHGLLVDEPAAFASTHGWVLPAGTWYPLIGRTTTETRWHLRLHAPAGYLTVTPLGIIRGSTPPGRPVSGRGLSLALLGGHLAPAARVGRLTVYAAADQTSLALRALRGTLSGVPWRERNTAACLADVLVPAPTGDIVWATVEGSIEMVAGRDDPPWQVRNAVSYVPGPIGMGIGLGPRFDYPAELNDNFPQTVVGLWLTGGRRALFPTGNNPVSVFTAGVVDACTGWYGNGTMVTPLSQTIGRLPRPALKVLTADVYKANAAGRLTLTALRQLVERAERQSDRRQHGS